MLNDALNYLKLGFSVIPVCWPVNGKCGCGRGHEGNSIAKSPIVPAWTVYQSRLPTVAEVTRWWTDAPLANIACITGAISKIAVVDLEYDGLAEALRLGLHSGLVSKTGKGKHLFYRHPGEKVCGTTKLNGIRGFDIRGDGNYVLLPPSRHASGKRYQWLTPVSGAGALPPFPKIYATSVTPASSSSRTVTVGKPEGWLSQALADLSNGNRNNTFASVVGRLHGQHWSGADIRALLLPHAMRVQFPESELDTIIRSIGRYPVNVGGSLQGGHGPAGGVEVPKLTVRTFAADWNDYERRKAAIKVGAYPTGYGKLDALIGGGLQKEELFTVAAWTGVGKTNFLLGACKSLCEAGRRVLYLSTEMSYRKIWDRYIALVGSAEGARKHQFIVSDEFIPNSGAIKGALLEHKPDVFIFDFIQNVSEENAPVEKYMKDLKEFAKDLEIAGMVAAQFNKSADFTDMKGNRIPPRMSMIKGSSAIIQVSAQILLLDEHDDTPEQKNILGVLDKNRDGEKGMVQFVLKKNPYRMGEL